MIKTVSVLFMMLTFGSMPGCSYITYLRPIGPSMGSEFSGYFSNGGLKLKLTNGEECRTNSDGSSFRGNIVVLQCENGRKASGEAIVELNSGSKKPSFLSDGGGNGTATIGEKKYFFEFGK